MCDYKLTGAGTHRIAISFGGFRGIDLETKKMNDKKTESTGNRFVIVLFCTLFGFVFTACGHASSDEVTPNTISKIGNDFAVNQMQFSSQATDSEIANMIFDLWLEHFTDESVNEKMRLQNHEILEVMLPAKFQTCVNDSSGGLFIAEITFSVQPYSNSSPEWIAGTGTIGENNWIQNKLSYVLISKTDELYSMQLLGIPPCSDVQ